MPKKPRPPAATAREIRRAQRRGHVVVLDDRARWERWWLTFTIGRSAQGISRVVAVVAVTAWRTAFGRWRVAGWPLWVAALAVLIRSPWPWAAAAGVVSLVPWTRGRFNRRARYLSDRESYLWAGAFAAVGIAALFAAVEPWWLPASAVAPPAAVWVWWRRIRRPSRFRRVWDEHVAPVKEFAGVQVLDLEMHDHPDGPEGQAVLRVPKGLTGKELAKLDDVLASHLAEGYRDLQDGAVVISRSPKDRVREARLLLCRPATMGRLIPWEGPSLDARTGAWKGGETGHGDTLLHFWQAAGGIHTGRIGGPGSGKGYATYLAGVEAELSPLILPIWIDGKRGKGIPALSRGGGLYCRTPGEWIVGITAYMRIMGLRLDEEGAAGESAFRPTETNPLLYLDVDEFRAVKSVWPQIGGDFADAAEQHRASGGHIAVNIHRGDADGWGELRTRSAFMAAGQILIGPAGDLSAAAVARQGYDVDPDALPPHPGWWYACYRTNGGGDNRRFRMLYLPPRNEVESLGLPAPAGVVEDYLAEAVTPTLATPAQQAVWDEARELIESGRANDPDITAEARAAAENAHAKQTADDLIKAALRQIPDGAGASQLADLGCGNRTYVQARLTALAKAGDLVQEEPGKPYRLPSTELEPAS